MKNDKYSCALCHGVFEKGWTDAEAMTEHAIDFAHLPPDDPIEVICDPCHQRFIVWARREGHVADNKKQ